MRSPTINLFTIFLLSLPNHSDGQLFPKPNNFKGDIREIKEIYYGKDLHLLKDRWKIHLRHAPSGKRILYQFNDQGLLVHRQDKLLNMEQGNWSFEYMSDCNIRSDGKKRTTRTIKNDGDFIEEECSVDDDGRINQIKCWYYDAGKDSKMLLIVEKDVMRDSNGNLLSYRRYTHGFNKDDSPGDYYRIYYDSLGRVIQVEEQKKARWAFPHYASETNGLHFIRNDSLENATVAAHWNYTYNDKNQVCQFEKIEYPNDPSSKNSTSIRKFYSYDKRGNVNKEYLQIGSNKKVLVYKRKIYYHKK
jgi:hypothetical protein